MYLADGIYAIVESSMYSNDEEDLKHSDMFRPLIKEVAEVDDDGHVKEWLFYLADVEAIEGPCCVVPDIGGRPNNYFHVKKRSEWVEDFIQWLLGRHTDDDMEGLD